MRGEPCPEVEGARQQHLAVRVDGVRAQETPSEFGVRGFGQPGVDRLGGGLLVRPELGCRHAARVLVLQGGLDEGRVRRDGLVEEHPVHVVVGRDGTLCGIGTWRQRKDMGLMVEIHSVRRQRNNNTLNETRPQQNSAMSAV